MNRPDNNGLKQGLLHGLPIGLGYFSVSFAFGMMCVTEGLPLWAAVLISMTNLTSAGQVAGLSVMLSCGTMLEMALTQLVINLRYALMSLSLSQKLHEKISTPRRAFIAFSVTDEIFAVASSRCGTLGGRYMLGLSALPYICWAFGTLCGAVAGSFMPPELRSALGIALYGMFIAIIIPPSKKNKAVLLVVALSAAASCLLRLAPVFDGNNSGFVIIIAAVAASVLCAWLFPVKEAEQ